MMNNNIFVLVFLIILSLLPVSCILYYIYYRDKFEKEPIKPMLKSFLGGVLASLILLLYFKTRYYFGIEFLKGNQVYDSIFSAFFEAAIPEEVLKFLILLLIIWRNKHFNERFDGLLYAVLVAMGFASVENLYYVLSIGVEAGLVRAIIDIPVQALYGIVMGFYLSRAKFEKKRRRRNILFAVFIPILFHGIYNFLNLYSLTFTDLTWKTILLYLFLLVFIISIWVFGLRTIKEEVNKSPFMEAESQKP